MEIGKQNLTKEEKIIEYLKIIKTAKESGWIIIYERDDLDAKILKDTLLAIKGKGSGDCLFLQKVIVKDYASRIEQSIIYIERDGFKIVVHFFNKMDWD